MAKDLLQKALTAHGGLDRWNSFDTVQATIVIRDEGYATRHPNMFLT